MLGTWDPQSKILSSTAAPLPGILLLADLDVPGLDGLEMVVETPKLRNTRSSMEH